jgi:hypothetical protein
MAFLSLPKEGIDHFISKANIFHNFRVLQMTTANISNIFQT